MLIHCLSIILPCLALPHLAFPYHHYITYCNSSNKRFRHGTEKDNIAQLGPLDPAEVELIMRSRQQQFGTMVSPLRPWSSENDATVVADDIVLHSNRKRKNSDISRSFSRDVPGELVMNQSYQNAN